MAADVMTALRVALLEMPPRLRDILVDALRPETGIEVVHRPVADERLSDVHADVLVYAVADVLDPGRPAALLGERPRARVVTIDPDGSRGALFELRPARLRLQRLSLAGLVGAIRKDDPDPAAWELPEQRQPVAAGAGSGIPRRQIVWREKP